MSAFEVSNQHIAHLVGWAQSGTVATGLSWTWQRDGETTYQTGRIRPGQDTTGLGQMLWDENMRSVAYRYSGEPSGLEYRDRALSVLLSPVAALKALDCYEYQSCEHPGWESSEAAAFCRALRSKLIRSLPGYDDADWAIAGPTHTVENLSAI